MRIPLPHTGALALTILLAAALGVAACSSEQPGEDQGTAGAGANLGGSNGNGGANPGGSAGNGGALDIGNNAGAGGNGGSLAGSMSGGGPGEGGAGEGGAYGGAGAEGGAATSGGMGGSAGAGQSGGVAGDGGGSATGGTGAFEPCPTDGSPCIILPLGDSITHGDKSSDRGGYRSRLYELILAADQKVTFTGSRSEGPEQVSGQPFPRRHEGHPGWTIDPGYNTNPAFDGGISQLIPSPALDDDPHIILLCIGTNDLFARDTAEMAARLDVFLDTLVANAPNSLIVLAQITPLADANAALTAYNEEIPRMVQSRAAEGQHIMGVDMSTLPPSGLHSDGTHPNDSGYAYMADVWYAAIKDLLPQ